MSGRTSGPSRASRPAAGTRSSSRRSVWWTSCLSGRSARTEQHGVDDGYLPSQLTLIAGLGTVTSRVRFRTNALLLPLYSWRRVVEEAIVADLLSGGRVDLGVAVGNYAREFELFGADITKRGELMEAALPFIRMGLRRAVPPE